MNGGLMTVALMAGAANWAFRYLPIRASRSTGMPGGAVGRFLAATGPAAVGTLFVASVLTFDIGSLRAALPPLAGTGMVAGSFMATRSVAVATIAGAVIYGLVFALAGS